MRWESDIVQIVLINLKWTPFKRNSMIIALRMKKWTYLSMSPLKTIVKSEFDGDKVIIVKCTLNVAFLLFSLSSFFFIRLRGLIFNEQYEDILYVIQNGSLLRIDADFQSFDIYEHYCLDMDDQKGILTAIVCEFDDMLFRVNRAQALIFATCMLISVPVSDIYFIAHPLTSKNVWYECDIKRPWIFWGSRLLFLLRHSLAFKSHTSPDFLYKLIFCH